MSTHTSEAASPGSSQGASNLAKHPGSQGSVDSRPRRHLNPTDVLQRFGLLGLWGAMVLVYSAIEPTLFPRTSTAQTIFNSQATLLFLVAALLCTIIVGEFVDLSIATNLGLAGTLLPVLVVNHGWGVWPAAAVAFTASVLAGVINGYLVVKLGINTIVVTLGMGSVLLGLALWMSDLTLVTGLDSGFAQIAIFEVATFPLTFWYGLIIFALFAYVLAYTPLGTHMRFVGSNHEVARLAGVRVERIRFGAFVAAGAFCGAGGVLAAAALGGYDPVVSQTYLMPAFAATYLGTAVILPGRFNPIGSWIAIYFLATGILGLQLLGGTGWVAHVFYGAVLVVAVAASTFLSRRRAR